MNHFVTYLKTRALSQGCEGYDWSIPMPQRNSKR